jgi:hypothetical protein
VLEGQGHNCESNNTGLIQKAKNWRGAGVRPPGGGSRERRAVWRGTLLSRFSLKPAVLQGLKPAIDEGVYVRAEARTLQTETLPFLFE